MSHPASIASGHAAGGSLARPIYCIGDSHVCFFGGQDTIQPTWPDRSADQLNCFITHHLGPALAYNLSRSGTKTQGREKLFGVLERAVPDRATVLLCFGEIDCRAHVLKQASQRRVAVEIVVNECLDQYFQVVREVQALGFRVIVYNAVPSAIRAGGNSRRADDYVAVGDIFERNSAIQKFNAGARERCATVGAQFLEFAPELRDAKGLPIMWYYFDTIHLSQRAMPLALRALSKLLPEQKFPQLRVHRPNSFEKITDLGAKRVRRWLKQRPPLRTTRVEQPPVEE